MPLTRNLLKARKYSEGDDYFLMRGGHGKQKQNMLRNAKCCVTNQTHLYPKHWGFINTNSNALWSIKVVIKILMPRFYAMTKNNHPKLNGRQSGPWESAQSKKHISWSQSSRCQWSRKPCRTAFRCNRRQWQRLYCRDCLMHRWRRKWCLFGIR